MYPSVTRLLAITATLLVVMFSMIHVEAANSFHLGPADSGKTITVKVGDHVEVRLPDEKHGGVQWVYSEVVSSDTNVLVRIDRGGFGLFYAEAAGSSDLTADEHCKPEPPKVCLLMVRQWKVQVNVEAH
ncbi:hypothetical protein DFQ27_003457 [Actinomortierella ambigua]|uniref:Proteinase inhibitor I42 chagasin domain-containing protein n=1 Tax=Actinomortierella ambigua TaxID=1343610 RepID=A0A9P6Q903_9FUNG|nr:hypothetical protein DFQ27_003457 [Actinomortierella ambigua]